MLEVPHFKPGTQSRDHYDLVHVNFVGGAQKTPLRYDLLLIFERNTVIKSRTMARTKQAGRRKSNGPQKDAAGGKAGVIAPTPAGLIGTFSRYHDFSVRVHY